MSTQTRQPAGTPTGGQFATLHRAPAPPGVLWSPELADAHERVRRLAGDLEVNGGDTSTLEAELAPLGGDVARAAAVNLLYAHQAFAALDAQYSDWTEDHPQDEAVLAVDYGAYADEEDPDFAGYHEAVSGEYRIRYEGLVFDTARALAGETDDFTAAPFGTDLPTITYQRSIQAPMAA